MAVELNTKWCINETIARLYVCYGNDMIYSDNSTPTTNANRIIYIEDFIEDNCGTTQFCIYDNFTEKKIYISLIEDNDSMHSASVGSFIYLPTPPLSVSSSSYEIIKNNVSAGDVNSTANSTIHSRINSTVHTPHSTPCDMFSGQETPHEYSSSSFHLDARALIHRLQIYQNEPIKYSSISADNCATTSADKIKLYLINKLSLVEPRQYVIYREMSDNTYVVSNNLDQLLCEYNPYHLISVRYKWIDAIALKKKKQHLLCAMLISPTQLLSYNKLLNTCGSESTFIAHK